MSTISRFTFGEAVFGTFSLAFALLRFCSLPGPVRVLLCRYGFSYALALRARVLTCFPRVATRETALPFFLDHPEIQVPRRIAFVCCKSLGFLEPASLPAGLAVITGKALVSPLKLDKHSSYDSAGTSALADAGAATCVVTLL